jgi:outer membrane protein TolC
MSKLSIALLLAALALLASGASVQAAAGGSALTLPGAQARALERSRLLDAKDNATSAARERALAAAQLPDPVLKLGVESLPIDGPQRWSIGEDFMTMRRIGVMQEFPRAEKRQLASRRFERVAELAQAEKAVVAASIERDSALAWLERYYTEQMALLIAEQAELMKQEILAVEALHRAGRARQAQVLAAHASLALIEDRASDIARRMREAGIALARWTGDAARLPLAGPPDTDALGLDLQHLDTQLERHPELAVLGKQIDIAHVDTGLARAERKADWRVQLAFLQRGSQYSNMVSFGVEIPLQWDRKNRQDRELSARLSQAEQVSAERDDALRMHVAQVQAMLSEWTTYRERLTRYQQVLIPLAQSRVDADMAAYRGGTAGLDDLLAARRSVTDARLQAAQLALEKARLWARLRFYLPAAGQTHPTLAPHKDSR